MEKEIMSEHEVADLLGVHLRTLQRQRTECGLPFPHVRVGDRVLYARQAVMQAFFDDAYTPAPSPIVEPVQEAKRGRGRPKNVTAPVITAATEKRKAGRPRKIQSAMGI